MSSEELSNAVTGLSRHEAPMHYDIRVVGTESGDGFGDLQVGQGHPLLKSVLIFGDACEVERRRLEGVDDAQFASAERGVFERFPEHGQ